MALRSTLKSLTLRFIHVVFKDNQWVFEEFEVKDTVYTWLMMHKAFDIKSANF